MKPKSAIWPVLAVMVVATVATAAEVFRFAPNTDRQTLTQLRTTIRTYQGEQLLDERAYAVQTTASYEVSENGWLCRARLLSVMIERDGKAIPSVALQPLTKVEQRLRLSPTGALVSHGNREALLDAMVAHLPEAERQRAAMAVSVDRLVTAEERRRMSHCARFVGRPVEVGKPWFDEAQVMAGNVLAQVHRGTVCNAVYPDGAVELLIAVHSDREEARKLLAAMRRNVHQAELVATRAAGPTLAGKSMHIVDPVTMSHRRVLGSRLLLLGGDDDELPLRRLETFVGSADPVD